jgi:pimeloyl-ACP methyl ester carboxylesterase
LSQPTARPGHLGIAILIACLLSSCSHPPSRLAQTLQRVEQAGWVSETIDTGNFRLQSYHPYWVCCRLDRLTIYIEGDGLAWLNRDTPSVNPTPRQALALQLALLHNSPAVAYLARPCQYVDLNRQPDCRPHTWTLGRFNVKQIQAMNTAIDALKSKAGASSLRLIGYSGGGVIAAILAAQRSDIFQLITIASPLDTEAWTQWHQVSPLEDAINPVDLLENLSHVPQLHLAGALDQQVPSILTQHFVRKAQQGESLVAMQVMPEFDHQCCWVAHWPSLLKRTTESYTTSNQSKP